MKFGAVSADRNATPSLIIVLILIALGLALQFGGSTLEDAHITFRYARNMAEGAGVGVWNVGQAPVEGATSFLWMLVLGTGMKLGISPFFLSKLIGLGSFVGIILLFGHLHRVAGPNERISRGALAAAVLTALYVPLAWYSVSGMETTFFSFLVALVVVSVVGQGRGPCWAFADISAVVMLVLARPEGIAFALFLAIFKFSLGGQKGLKRFMPLGAFVITLVGTEAYRFAHFGDLLPNTYYAKASGGAVRFFFDFGVSYLRDFRKNTWPIWLALLVGGFVALKRRDWTRPELMLVLIVVIYFGYVLRVGGDPVSALPLWRHFVHIAPVWLFLAGAALARLSRNNLRAITLAVLVALLTATIMWKKTILHTHLLDRHPGFATQATDNAYFDFVNRFADRNQIAAVALAGQWGWYVPITTIDMLGLNDRHIANYGKFQDRDVLDSKTDMPFVMAQKPTIIDGYVSGRQLRQGHCPKNLMKPRPDMVLGILQSPGFLEEYFFVSNAPYEVLDRALFISASVADAARAAGADLVPLQQTVMSDQTCLPRTAATGNH